MMLAEKRHNGEILHSPPYWLPPPSGHVADQAADLIVLFITIDTIKTFRDGNHEVALAALKCLVEKVNRVFSLWSFYNLLYALSYPVFSLGGKKKPLKQPKKDKKELDEAS